MEYFLASFGSHAVVAADYVVAEEIDNHLADFSTSFPEMAALILTCWKANFVAISEGADNLGKILDGVVISQ